MSASEVHWFRDRQRERDNQLVILELGKIKLRRVDAELIANALAERQAFGAAEGVHFDLHDFVREALIELAIR